MGILIDTMSRLIPEKKAAIAATVPTWQIGTPQYQYPALPYHRYAQDGYAGNEIVFACVEELSTSAAEPRIAAYIKGAKEPQKLPDHPILDLLERPNPYMDRYTLVASVIMYLSVAGNAYLEKVRSKATKVVELWPLRPDRIKVIPGRGGKFIEAYRYEIGAQEFDIAAKDLIHIKYRNPLDDYYGLAPLSVVARRVDTDNWMREFTRSFFANAGVPAGLLNIRGTVNETERAFIQRTFRARYGGEQGWHKLMVIENQEATYTPMGLPLGDQGLVIPHLDEIDEARLAMVWGVPLELIGGRIGMVHGNRSTTKEARATFWMETLLPLYQFLAARLNSDLVPEFAGVDYVEFDTSTIGALREDDDLKHKRARDDMLSGLITREEARVMIGNEPEVDSKQYFVIPANLSVHPVGEEVAKPATEQGAPGGNPFGGNQGNEPGGLAPPLRIAKTLRDRLSERSDLYVDDVDELEALFASRAKQLGVGATNGKGNGNGNH